MKTNLPVALTVLTISFGTIISSCKRFGTGTSSISGSESTVDELQSGGFEACRDRVLAKAKSDFIAQANQSRGSAVDRSVIDSVNASVRTIIQPSDVIDLSMKQPEFTTEIWDYMSALVDKERIKDGIDLSKSNAQILDQIEKQHHVDGATVLAVWGVETDYGRIQGKRNVVESLLTLVCQPNQRSKAFIPELFAALKILYEGNFAFPEFVGSWAGAFGKTQFMPTTFLELAVDHNGDGKRDLINDSADALASTANFLKTKEWLPGQPWGLEVSVPSGFPLPDAKEKFSTIWKGTAKPISEWTVVSLPVASTPTSVPDGSRPSAGTNGDVNSGVENSNSSAQSLNPADKVALIAPAGRTGPKFLVTQNFKAYFAYNNSIAYALAISVLSDAIRTNSTEPREFAWPNNGDAGLSRAERKELQELLLSAGCQIGQADGKIGDLTQRAIAQVRPDLCGDQSNRASQKLLGALRSARDEGRMRQYSNCPPQQESQPTVAALRLNSAATEFDEEFIIDPLND